MIKGLSSLTNKLDRMQRRLNRGTKIVASRELQTVASLARLNLAKGNSVASGQLSGAFFVKEKTAPQNVSRITLTNIKRYAAFVEYGIGDLGATTPDGQTFGEPSLTPRLITRIFAWSIMKGIIPVQMDRQMFANRVAQRIAGETSKPSGHAPTYYMTNAWRARKQSLKNEMRKTVKRAIR